VSHLLQDNRSRQVRLTTKLTLTFTVTFIAVIAIGAAMIPVASGLYRLSKWLERKTGNSTLAHNLPALLFVALIAAAGMTAAIALNHK
jgi:hypothetical protein